MYFPLLSCPMHPCPSIAKSITTSAMDSLAPTSFSGDESDSRPSHGKRPSTAGTGIRRSGCAANRYSYGYSTATITRSLWSLRSLPFPFHSPALSVVAKMNLFLSTFFFSVTYSGMAAMGGSCVRACCTVPYSRPMFRFGLDRVVVMGLVWCDVL